MHGYNWIMKRFFLKLCYQLKTVLNCMKVTQTISKISDNCHKIVCKNRKKSSIRTSTHVLYQPIPCYPTTWTIKQYLYAKSAPEQTYKFQPVNIDNASFMGMCCYWLPISHHNVFIWIIFLYKRRANIYVSSEKDA